MERTKGFSHATLHFNANFLFLDVVAHFGSAFAHLLAQVRIAKVLGSLVNFITKGLKAFANLVLKLLALFTVPRGLQRFRQFLAEFLEILGQIDFFLHLLIGGYLDLGGLGVHIFFHLCLLFPVMLACVSYMYTQLHCKGCRIFFAILLPE